MPSFSVTRDAAVAAGVGPFAGDEPALRVEVEPVGPAARVAELGRLAGLRVELHDAVADVGEVDAAVGAVGRPFGELALAPELFELGPVRDDGVVVCAGEIRPSQAKDANRTQEWSPHFPCPPTQSPDDMVV